MTNVAGSVTFGNNAGTAVILASGSSTSGTSCPAGISVPEGIAFDGSSNAWIANNSGSLSELDSTGAAVTGCNGLSGTTNMAMSGIQAIIVDGSGNVWAANHGSGNIYEFVGSATPVVTPIVAGLSAPYTPASRPWSIAFQPKKPASARVFLWLFAFIGPPIFFFLNQVRVFSIYFPACLVYLSTSSAFRLADSFQAPNPSHRTDSTRRTVT
jgi:hypothetical protein